MDKPLPRLPWRRTYKDTANDYTAELEVEGQRASARMHEAPSGIYKWVWSASFGSMNDNGGAAEKQACADAATKAVWDLKRREDMSKDMPKGKEMHVDLNLDTRTLEDVRFVLRWQWGESLWYESSPAHVRDLYDRISKTLQRRRGEKVP